MVIQGRVLGAVGAGGTSPIPKISPHPGGGRERGAFLCRQLSRWGGWKCIPLGGRDGSWGGLDRDGGNKRHTLDPPPCLLGLILPAGLGKEEGAGWAPYKEAASTACPPSPSATFPRGGEAARLRPQRFCRIRLGCSTLGTPQPCTASQRRARSCSAR